MAEKAVAKDDLDLFEAIAKGLKAVKLEKGTDVNIKNEDHETALMVAIKQNNVELVELLLNFGADIHKRDSQGSTALHHSVKSGNIKIVQLIINCGAEIDETNAKGETALHCATSEGHPDIMKFLLSHGANANLLVSNKDQDLDDNYCDGLPTNALNLAVASGNVKSVKVLLDHGVDVTASDELYESPVEKAIGCFDRDPSMYSTEELTQMTRTTILEQLLVYGTSANNIKSSSSILCLAGYKHRYYVQLLLDYGADFNVTGVMHDIRYSIILDFPRKQKAIECAKIITEFAVKQRSENVRVLPEIFEFIDSFSSLWVDYDIKCEAELERMKSETFEDSTITFYNFLTTKDLNQLESFARNEKIVEFFASDEYTTKFPIYFCSLYNQLRKGLWRKLMVNRVRCFFPAIADVEGNEKLPKLTFNCTNIVLSYLSNKDLRMLICVCNPVNGFDIENV